MKPVSKATKTVTWAAACCTLVAGFEGCWTTARVDRIGTGRPLTWCYGETIGPAKPGEHFTKAQCDAMLEKRLPTYWANIKPCIKVETSNNEKIAYTSTSYNIGARAFCHSAMVSRLNAGNHTSACNALMSWTHAQGRVVKGLVNRRAAERKICLTPDPVPVLEATPYVCTPHQAEAGECLPLIETPKVAPNNFCSGSGQGADCPRDMPWWKRIFTLVWWTAE